jgi:YHS domain-containing protein
MKLIKNISALALMLSFVAAPLTGFSADKKKELKPYTLDHCMVSGDKLDEMGKPFVMEYKGQEIKLCCKNCKKDFDKNPAKYIKKMKEAEAKAAKSDKTKKSAK